MIYVAPDFDAQNSALLAKLPLPQLLRVLNATQNSRGTLPLPVPQIPVMDDPIAERHEMTDAAKIKLASLNHVAWFKRAANPPEVAKFRNFPREPGTHTPPAVKRDPKDVAKAKRIAKELSHIQDLEDALVTAKARLETLK